MRKSIELRNELGTLNNEYRQVLDAASAAKRPVNTEEKEKLAKMDARLDELSGEIQLHEKQEEREAKFGGRREGGNPTGDPVDPKQKKDPKGIRASAEYVEAFDRFITTGAVGQVSPEIRNALSADSDVGGGYLTASEEFSSRLIEVVDNEVFIRGMATKTTLTATF